jgi:hypothetical protein
MVDQLHPSVDRYVFLPRGRARTKLTISCRTIASTGSNVSVNALSIRDGTTSLIVAGAFATAGSLGCAAVCSWDIADTRWSSLGAGLQSGEVRAIDFAGVS